MLRTVGVGIYGAGTVAGRVIQILRQKAAEFATLGIQFDVRTVCCRDASRARDFDFDSTTVVTTDKSAILNDARVDMVVEVMGGLTDAKDVVFGAISKDKHVVTANKALLGKYVDDVIALCEAHPSVRLGFEAAVAGGIPIIRVLQQAMYGDAVTRIAGIINGTTNFMLTAMTAGATYGDILKQAQDLGYAEADPSADVDGWDAQSKLLLLIKLAFGITLTSAQVPTTGISSITSDDIAFAAEMGCAIKLLGVAQKNDDHSLSAFVWPTFVKQSDTLAAVSGASNIVQVTSSNLGSASYVGPGAGRYPTANSVVADMVNIALGTASAKPFPVDTPAGSIPFQPDFAMPWYIRTDSQAAFDAVAAALSAAGQPVTLKLPLAASGCAAGVTVVASKSVIEIAVLSSGATAFIAPCLQ